MDGLFQCRIDTVLAFQCQNVRMGVVQYVFDSAAEQDFRHANVRQYTHHDDIRVDLFGDFADDIFRFTFADMHPFHGHVVMVGVMLATILVLFDDILLKVVGYRGFRQAGEY